MEIWFERMKVTSHQVFRQRLLSPTPAPLLLARLPAPALTIGYPCSFSSHLSHWSHLIGNLSPNLCRISVACDHSLDVSPGTRSRATENKRNVLSMLSGPRSKCSRVPILARPSPNPRSKLTPTLCRPCLSRSGRTPYPRSPQSCPRPPSSHW